MKTEVKFRRQFDPNYKGSPSPIIYGPSKTVPDQNLTVRQLMERHTRGHGIGAIQREEIYMEDEEVPRLRDLSDISYRKDELQERARELEAKMRSEREAKKQADEQKQTQSVEPVKPRAAKEEEGASETKLSKATDDDWASENW